MKSENSEESLPVVKKNLPDTIYPGVPIEETPAAEPAEEAAADEPAAGVGSEAPPTEEERKAAEKELAKANAGAAVYGASLVLLLILTFGPYIKFVGSLFGLYEPYSKENMSVAGVFAALALFLLFPTFCSALAARIARWFVGTATHERLSPYLKVFFAINGLVIAIFVQGRARLLFIIPEAISLILTSAVLTYNGGGFLQHLLKIIKNLFYAKR